MKKILKISGAIFSLATVTLFSSCLKDNAHYVNFANGGTLIELPLVEPNAAGSGGVAQTVAYPANDSADTLTVAVNVASPKVPTSPTTVTFSTTDTTALHANAAGQYQVLPAADYKIVGGNTVTVSAGQRLAYIKVVINPSAIGTANSGVYALPITLVSASQPIAQPYKAIYYVVNIKSEFEADYTVTGTMKPSATSAYVGYTGVFPSNVTLVTQSATSVAYYDDGINTYATQIATPAGTKSSWGSFAPVFTFDANGNITSVTNYWGQNSGSHSRSAVLDPTGQNKILSGKPGTAGFTFQVSYIMQQAGVNTIYYNETFTYSGGD